ncbi:MULTISPECIES: LytTR family DNA-binding domain-containing protein [Yimella]|uniref:LytTR family two component transcriptional regulator n=1 Tax=Yimella lutea TaxID=587872 RepID=A0A542EF01_9MICO|nr:MULTISPECIES: LytTR family DNA-binding domain-containing protein [Yimella]MCG8655907.1 LytTR family DNA-binding domain-containing protein [Yimella sp. NH-Cas1]TQJ13895.1 LytTR family two component transcriptional regulator [Yimella lutea]
MSAAPLSVLVVDDEAPTRSELAWLLDQDERIGTVLQAASGGEVLDLLDFTPVDVVFSDINMPGLDGMQLARVIARLPQRPQVVLVTAYDEYAVDAFAIDVVDYVMKPVRPERLAQAVGKCVGATAAQAEPEGERIPVERGGVTRFILRSDVRYVQAMGDYAELHTPDGTHLVRIPLNTLEERWAAAGFVRIHRSTLVCTRFVSELHMDDGRCSVTVDGTSLQVSRRHTRELRQHLLQRGEI